MIGAVESTGAPLVVVAEGWRTAYPAASAGILAMNDVVNPDRHPALDAQGGAGGRALGSLRRLGVGSDPEAGAVRRLPRSLQAAREGKVGEFGGMRSVVGKQVGKLER